MPKNKTTSTYETVPKKKPKTVPAQRKEVSTKKNNTGRTNSHWETPKIADGDFQSRGWKQPEGRPEAGGSGKKRRVAPDKSTVEMDVWSYYTGEKPGTKNPHIRFGGQEARRQI